MEFKTILEKLKIKYQQMLDNLDPNDPNFATQMANCAACYERCLKEILDYYETAIAELESSMNKGSSGSIDQDKLRQILARIQQAFNNLGVEVVNNQSVLQTRLTGTPVDFSDLLEGNG